MKSRSGYMDRAMRASDPRFARVLTKLGYGRRDMRPAAEPAVPTIKVPIAPIPPKARVADDIDELRTEYEAAAGKRAFWGWDADALRERTAAAKRGD